MNMIYSETRKLAASDILKPFDGRSVLITGATGLVGSYLTATLNQRQGVSVRATSGDLTAPGALENVRPADFIIHAATYAQPLKFLRDEMETIDLNTRVTAELLTKVRTGGRFLFMSSAEVYIGGACPSSEDSAGGTMPDHARACYIEGKRCGEAICQAYQRSHPDIAVRIARLALAYGPGFKSTDERVLTSFIKRGMEEGIIRLKDTGADCRTFVYVLDAAQMLFNVLLHGKHAVYNVGGESRTTIGDLGKRIAHRVGARFEAARDDAGAVPGSPPEVALNINRYCTEFGKPSFIGLDEGLDRAVQWYRDGLASAP